MAAGEFVSEWDFNVNPVPSNSITIGTPTITGNIVVNSATFSANSLRADGDGYFDLGFTFSTSGQNSGTERFTVGESITFLLTGNGLDAMDFLSMSSADSGVQNENGLLYTGAHVQGITVPGVSGTQSAWITTPVPAAAWLLGSGLLGLIAIRRRVKK